MTFEVYRGSPQLTELQTDARVQTVTESKHSSRSSSTYADLVLKAMNVLRMIKLFGWESKMGSKIAEKRDEELKWTKKGKILAVVNGNLKYVPLIF